MLSSLCQSKPLVEFVKIGLAGNLVNRLIPVVVDLLTVKSELKPLTQILHTDWELNSLFSRLQPFRKLESQLFDAAVHNADRLVYRYTQLREGRIVPDLHDRRDAWFFYDQSRDDLLEIVKIAVNAETTKNAVQIHRWYAQIHIRLQEYFRRVVALTEPL
jgi:hypothetical protein